MTTVRKLTQYVPLTREEFRKRFFERFYDPAFDGVIGYWEPYATSHDKLDAQPETFVQVENAAKSLARLVRDIRSGAYSRARRRAEESAPKVGHNFRPEGGAHGIAR